MADEDPDDLEAIEASNDASERQDAYDEAKAGSRPKDVDELLASLRVKTAEQQALLSQLAMWQTFKKLTGVDPETVASFSYGDDDITTMRDFVHTPAYREKMRRVVTRGSNGRFTGFAYPPGKYHTRYKTKDGAWHVLPEPLLQPIIVQEPT